METHRNVWKRNTIKTCVAVDADESTKRRSCPHLAKPHLAKTAFGQFWCFSVLSKFSGVVVVVGACWCLLVPVVACCCLLLLVVACCCLLLLFVAVCCFIVAVRCCSLLFVVVVVVMVRTPLRRTAPSPGPPRISLFFFSLPPKISFFLLSLGVFSLKFGGVFEALEPLNVHDWAHGLSCEPRRPRSRGKQWSPRRTTASGFKARAALVRFSHLLGVVPLRFQSCVLPQCRSWNGSTMRSR